MKRGPKPSGEAKGAAEQEELVKSTYKLPKTLKQNLQVVAMMEGKDQADLVREALDDFLRIKKDVDPTRSPRIVTHKPSQESRRVA